jgi:hypothetical protein
MKKPAATIRTSLLVKIINKYTKTLHLFKNETRRNKSVIKLDGLGFNKFNDIVYGFVLNKWNSTF